MHRKTANPSYPRLHRKTANLLSQDCPLICASEARGCPNKTGQESHRYQTLSRAWGEKEGVPCGTDVDCSRTRAGGDGVGEVAASMRMRKGGPRRRLETLSMGEDRTSGCHGQARVARAAGLQDKRIEAKRARRLLHLARLALGAREIWIHEQSDRTRDPKFAHSTPRRPIINFRWRRTSARLASP
jgi:hypothetical protein